MGHFLATATIDGLMAAADKSKLDGVSSVLWNNVVSVDATNGNDGTGARGNIYKPFATIAAALAAAAAGDLVFILPGTYSVAADITIPASVHVRGFSRASVIIQRTGLGAASTLITMGTGSSLVDVTLKQTTTGNFALTSVKFGSTTTADAFLRNVAISISNSGAGAVAAALTGILVQSTGTPDRTVLNAQDVSIVITADAAATGNMRCLLLDTSTGNFNAANIFGIITGGASSRIGAEINRASARLTLHSGYMNGATADVSQTAGTLELAAALTLANNTSNSLSWTVLDPIITQIATSTTDITTSSTTDVLATGMTITPVAGTYIVIFSGGSENSSNSQINRQSIYAGGSQVAGSEVGVSFGSSNSPNSFCCTAIVTVNGSQAIEGRWRTTSGTAKMHHRNLILIRKS